MNMIDPFGRKVDYLRVSVTDRCDFRCLYCMSENMTFLPKSELLSLEELDRVCSVFIEKGIKKLRITGGEPLVRKNIMSFFSSMSRHLESGALDELTVTTNGSQLEKYAADLYDLGVKRINVSLDTLNADQFQKITRWGLLEKVLNGIEEALSVGLKIKINTVALKHINEFELSDIMIWAHGKGMDFTVIETMPLGEVDVSRVHQYLPLTKVKQDLTNRFTLTPIDYKTGGPARYYKIEQTGGRLGMITPLTHNFCESCNRVRMTCTGQLYLCLGQEDKVDLRTALRKSANNDLLNEAIDKAISIKPKGHDFIIDRITKTPAVSRHMSVTGG